MALPTSGLTGHYDASTNGKLWKTFVSGGPNTGVPADGDTIAVWEEASGINRLWKQSAANGLPVWRQATPLMPLPCLDFTAGQRVVLTTNAAANIPLSNLITASAATTLIAFYAESITSTAGSYNAHPLIGDTSGYWGVFLNVQGGVPSVSGFIWSIVNKSLYASVTAGAPHVVMVRHDGTNIYISVDGGAESSLTCGNVDIVTGNVLLGAGTYGGGPGLDGRIGEIAVYNTTLTGTPLSDAITYFTAKWLPAAAGGPDTTTSSSQTLLLGVS